MKIKHLKLKNYKKFTSERIIPFDDSVNVIIGANGSGKTTILQAIVSLIASATQDIEHPSVLNWGGFNYELIQSGRRSPVAEVLVSFKDDEINSTLSFYQKLNESKNSLTTPPSKKHEITLKLDYESNKTTADSASQLFQFRGYTYAKQLSSLDSNKRYFDSVGSIFWYTEKRDNNSFKRLSSNGRTREDSLREFLNSRYNFHQRVLGNNNFLKEDIRDVYPDLAKFYHSIFTDRELAGPEPRLNPADAFEEDWFYISYGASQYEISEMSAGERAIFPILVDFTNYRINNSIIIVDEIELHLHPPLQQAFLRALPQLGQNNQFIITTHSDYIATLVDEAKIIRL